MLLIRVSTLYISFLFLFPTDFTLFSKHKFSLLVRTEIYRVSLFLVAGSFRLIQSCHHVFESHCLLRSPREFEFRRVCSLCGIHQRKFFIDVLFTWNAALWFCSGFGTRHLLDSGQCSKAMTEFLEWTSIEKNNGTLLSRFLVLAEIRNLKSFSVLREVF